MKEIYNKIINDPELIIASIVLFTSIASIFIGVGALFIQRTHNKKSILPIGVINLINSKNGIIIKIVNCGVGPMIIKSCTTKGISSSKECPYDWLPEGNFKCDYQKHLENNAIVPGDSLTLLHLVINLKDKESCDSLKEIRSIFKDLKLIISYKDIYGKNMIVSKKLGWFYLNV